MKEVKVVIMIMFIVQLPSQLIISQDSSRDSWVIQRSWGLGLTIPSGSILEDGGVVEWSRHSNVTVVLTLPNISYTDRTIYFIASIMTCGKTIIQAAVGIQPNNTYWTSNFMYVTNVYQRNKTYFPVLLYSPPYVYPSEKVSISIYYKQDRSGSDGSWVSSITNLSTSEKIEVEITKDNCSTFIDGEQEVVAFESYTSNEEVFKSMGEAALHSILVDGKKVLGGWYIDDGQVFDKNPLFEVGGGQVPPFISIKIYGDGAATWIYSKPTWSNFLEPSYLVMFFSILAISISIIVYVAYRMRG